MFRYIFALLFIGSFAVNGSYAQNSFSIKWYTLEEAQALTKNNPKPIFIDTYTHWCGWCKHLDGTTFKDPQIVTYLNNHFYPVKLNAESHDTISFKGKKYTNRFIGVSRRPTHDVAIEIFKGNRMSYPTLFLFDGKFERKQALPGYKKPSDLLSYLIYYKEQQYGWASNIHEFNYYFQNTHFGDTTGRFTGEKKVQWMTMNEALNASKSDSSKKLFIYIYHDFCDVCKVHDSTNFKNPAIVDYINQHYFPVKFDALSNEEFTISNMKFNNPEDDGSQIHRFVLSLVPPGKTYPFPIAVIFKNSDKYLDALPGYLSPEGLEVRLNYYGEDAYLTPDMSWKQFYQSFQYKSR